MIAMSSKSLDSVELYPKIVVYKNLFKDITKTTKLLEEESEDGLFSPWTKWSHFGEYINPLFKSDPCQLLISMIKEIKTTNLKQEEQKDAILELYENFYIATKDYANRFDIKVDDQKIVKTHEGENVKEWIINGPSIARYKTDITDPVAMTYHSDYIREPITSPGHKYVITALTYFNDNYSGGEIDFIVDGEAYMYKPQAGDVLVFPSGHPQILTKEGKIYLHGVMPAQGFKKYISRMYWMKYEPGESAWFEQEEKFGKEVWNKMQEKIMEEFRNAHPNKHSAEREKRIS
jgi:hypothetical protein